MSARVYFMKRVRDCKDVSIMSPQEDGQVYSVCRLQFSCFTKYNRMQSKHKQIVNIADENLMDYSFLRILSRYHSTKSKNYLKDDIEFVTEFPCLLEHPVFKIIFDIYSSTCRSLKTIIIIFPGLVRAFPKYCFF